MQVAYECLMRAIKAVKPGMRYADVGAIISAHAKANGFSVVKTYCGHGICEHFHCAPNVPHYAKNKAKGTMQVRQPTMYSQLVPRRPATYARSAWRGAGPRSAPGQGVLLVPA